MIPGIGIFTAILLLPYAVLLFHLPDASLPSWKELEIVFLKTVWQSFLSASIALIFGMWSALGLLSQPLRKREMYRFIFMLPNFLPTIFVVLAALNLFHPFPYGLMGVVIVHVMINIGLVAYLLSDSFEAKLGGVVELAMVEGARRWQILWRGVFPMLRTELILAFLTVFSICFSSFAIPLILGGVSATTIEILIYEKIKVMAQWSQALSLSVLQSLVLVGLTFFLRTTSQTKEYRYRDFSVLASRTGFFLGLFVTILLVVAPVVSLKVENIAAIFSEPLLDQVLGTLVIGVGSGLLCLLFLLTLIFFYPPQRYQKFLVSYVAPSTVLVGFSLLLLSPLENVFLKIILGFVLVIFPLIYRMRWFAVLNSLHSQVEMAGLLGAGRSLVFRKVLYPQSFSAACKLSGLCAFWATGDFAISSIVADRDLSLALMVQGLLGAYRIETAGVLIWPMLASGGLCYLFFVGLGYVGNQKSESHI